MFTNSSEYNKIEIQRVIDMYMANMPQNIPVKVDKINDNLTLDCSSLVDDRTFYNVQIFTPIGVSYKLERLVYGILLNVPFYFYSILSDGSITETITSGQTQYGMFIPIIDNNNNFNKDIDLSLCNSDNTNKIELETDNIVINNKDKAYMKLEDGSISISNNNDNNNIKLTTELAINSDKPISISTNTASLYEVLNDILNMLTKMNADPVAGNGSPLASPSLTSELPKIITKLNNVLK